MTFEKSVTNRIQKQKKINGHLVFYSLKSDIV